MSDHSESVKQIAIFLRQNADKTNNPDMENKLLNYAESLDLVDEELDRLTNLTKAFSTDLEDVDDLPSELIKELSIAKTDELEDQIVTVINANGKEANLDEILIGLYRKFKVTQKRRFINNKLYRMDMVWSIPGRKGYYTTEKPMTIEQKTGGFDDEYDDQIPF